MKEFDYRPNKILIIGSIIFFVLATVFLITQLVTDSDTGMIHRGRYISPGAKEIMMSLSVVFCYFLSVPPLYKYLVTRKKDMKIILESERFIIPDTGYFASPHSTLSVQYASVESIEDGCYQEGTFMSYNLAVVEFNSRKLYIISSYVANLDIYNEIIDTISDRVEENQAQR